MNPPTRLQQLMDARDEAARTCQSAHMIHNYDTLIAQEYMSNMYSQMVGSQALQSHPGLQVGLGNSQSHQQYTMAHSPALAGYAAGIAGQQGLGNAQNTAANDINALWRAPVYIADSAWRARYTIALTEARALRFAGEM